jgi:hypothetical protein
MGIISSFTLAIPSGLWHNYSMPRWFSILLAAAIGIALGLGYGWILAPVEYTDITPDALRVDYRSDYILMVAEAFQGEGSAAQAARRLALLGSDPPATYVDEAYGYAQDVGYANDDLLLLSELSAAMQAWQPIPETASP